MLPLLRSHLPVLQHSLVKCYLSRSVVYLARSSRTNSINHHNRHRWLPMASTTTNSTTPARLYHRHGNQFVQHQNGPVLVSREVLDAIRSRSPVVALESTIITHGMPYPHNLQTALQVESIIRNNGSVPATIGIIDGTVFVGLQRQQLEQLALKASDRQGRMMKVSRSDLAMVCALGECGGTTVSATSYLANLIGIRVFVTGGIGGVHRGAEVTMDISADLAELSRTPITVVSAGIKSILDIGKTLEVLETNGVCVAVYKAEVEDATTGQVTFPAFFTPDSGISVNYNLKTAQSVARLIQQRDALQLDSGILLAVPNHIEEGKIYHQKVERALEQAEQEMREKDIHGKGITPFLLARISELTGGESLKLNQQLIEHNALVGAEVAVEYSRLVREQQQHSTLPPNQSFSYASGGINQSTSGQQECSPASQSSQSDNSPSSQQSTSALSSSSPSSSSSIPVVIGGSIYDIVTKADSRSVQLDGSTYAGSVQTSLGGVARNISDAILRLGQQCLLITAVGNDRQGQLVRQNNPNSISTGIRVLDDLPTSACSVTIDGNGECILVIGDLRVHQRIDPAFVSQFECQLNSAPIVIMDGNISTTTMDYVLAVCRQSRVPVWFEPTDSSLVNKILDRPTIASANFEAIKFLSPNFAELQVIYREVFGKETQLIDSKDLTKDQIVKISFEYGNKLLANFATINGILVTIGEHGIVYISRDPELDSTIHLGPNSKLFEFKDRQVTQQLYLPQEKMAQVVNVSGAGDCLVSAIIVGLLHQQSIRQSLELGLKAAQLSVNTHDTVPQNIQQILKHDPMSKTTTLFQFY